MSKFRMRRVVGVLGAFALAAGAAAGCGNSFTADDCMKSRTCSGGGGTAFAGEGGDAAAAGTKDPSHDGGAGEGGAAGLSAGNSCQRTSDCSNGDPTDGEEQCLEGSCRAGNAPPRVVAITPEDGAKAVEPDSTIAIEFNEALDEATVTHEHVQASSGGQLIDGDLTYANKQVTFKPAAPLSLGRPIQVLITKGVTDEGGVSLLQETKATFEVREGAWKSLDVIQEKSMRLAPQLPMTSTGAVLVAWLGSRGQECPASARWFQRGAALTPLITFSDAVDPGTNCSWISAASNQNGVASVAWTVSTPLKQNRYARGFRDDRWQEASALVEPEASGAYFKTAVTPAGMALLFEGAYGERPRVWYTEANDTWAAEPKTLSPALVASEFLPTIGFDATGNGLVVWHGNVNEEGTTYAATFSADTGSFGAGAKVADGRSDGGDPSVAVAPDGQAVAAWYIGAGARLDASYFSSGTWKKAETISSNLHEVAYYSARDVVYDGERFVAAWDASQNGQWRSYTALFDPATGWTIPEPHQAPGEPPATSRSTHLATDGNGTTLLVWVSHVDATSAQLIAQRYRDGAWEPSAPIPGTIVSGRSIRDVALSMNASGMAAVSWVSSDDKGNATGIGLATLY